MVTKTKLTITINKELLIQFNKKIDENDVNKSKLVSRLIKEWLDKK